MNVNTASVMITQGNIQGAWDLLKQDPLTHAQQVKMTELFAAIRKRPFHCRAETAPLFQLLSGLGCNRHRYGSSANYLAVPSSPLGPQIERVSIEFSNALRGDDLDFDPKELNIQCYLNYNELRLRFNFWENGFEYGEFQGPMLSSIERLSTQPYNTDYRMDLSRKMIDYLTVWGKQKGIDFDYVGLLGFFYRNSDTTGDGSRPAFFAHVDFKESDMKNTLRAFQNEWKPNLEQTLGSMSDEEYSSLNVVQIVNAWIPFNPSPTSNTLAVMDLSGVQPSGYHLDEYVTLTPTHAAEFTTLILRPDPSQNWVAHNMSIGKVLFFNSFKEPHASVNTSWGQPYGRRSCEGRFLFGKL